jgi:hypothetical protein
MFAAAKTSEPAGGIRYILQITQAAKAASQQMKQH